MVLVSLLQLVNEYRTVKTNGISFWACGRYDSSILLTMSCGGDRYISHLSFDDPNFCHEICELLKHYYGWPIKKIAELDVP